MYIEFFFPVVFLIDISNTPQHIRTRLRSHFNQIWHILACSLSLILYHFLAMNMCFAYISMEYFMKFLTHIPREMKFWIGNFDLYDLFHMCVPWMCVKGVDWCILYTENVDKCKWFFVFGQTRKRESSRWRGLKNFISHNRAHKFSKKKVKQSINDSVSTECRHQNIYTHKK